jgi:hypothetical protein
MTREEYTHKGILHKLFKMTIIKKRGKNIKISNLDINEIKTKSLNSIIYNPKTIPSSFILHLIPQKLREEIEFGTKTNDEDSNFNIFSYDPLINTPTPFVPTDNTGFSETYSFLPSYVEKDSNLQSLKTTTGKDIQMLNSESIWCWWCCHAFQNKSFLLPLRKKNDGIIESIGCFCSPECISAYIMETGSKYGNKWEQLELLHSTLKSKEKIISAPPREQLAVFGGKLSCEEFRKTKNKQSYIVYAPMISLKVHIDDLNEYDSNCALDTNQYIDINNLNIDTFEKLPKSNKSGMSVNNDNTLDKFVDIK